MNLALAATRGSWGLLLLAVPGRIITLAGDQDTPRARAVGRVLGGRQLGQAALVAAGWRPAVWPLGPAADLAHAATAAGLAYWDPRWRRVGVADTVVALSFAISTIVAAR
jgi:hypothetical protein